MNNEYIITSDNNCDLPRDFLSENGVELCYLSFTMDNETYDGVEKILDDHVFYDKMRGGQMPTTAQVNPSQLVEMFKKHLDEGKDILHIAFSSNLSGTYNNAIIAKEELEKDYQQRKIIVIDSLAASLGQGMLIFSAVNLKKQGKTIDEVANWVEENKLHACHFFTVSDLNHLYRGGRVSKTAAFLGTLIHIKPILYVDNEGRLIPSIKVKGRKKSIETLVQKMKQNIGDYENDTIFISHGDCAEDIEYLKQLINKEFGEKNFVINFVSPTIGAHSGPDTIALFFYGNSRII
ncbi:MAG: DegV family protein [Oscillospiraceae bacterium]